MYGCPGCGSGMVFDIPTQMLKCNRCDRTERIEEADRREARTAGSSFSVDLLTCPTCGAEIRTMNTAQAAFCSYCGSSVMLEQRSSAMEAPETVAPFRVTREECFEKYRQMVKKSLCADRKLKKDVSAESFRGIYVPNYVYDAAVLGETVLEGHETKGNNTYYYNTTVSLNHRFSNIVHDASREMPDAMSEKIARVEPEAFKPFSPAYLSGFYADVPDTDPEAYIPFAKAEAVRLGLKDVMRDLPQDYSYSTADAEKKLVNMSQAECKGATLIPVWFMSIRSKGRLLYSMMNGVTGEMVADVPMDIPRFGLIALLVAIPLFFLFNSLFMLRPEMVLIVAMLLAIGAQAIVNRRRRNIADKEEAESAKDGGDNLVSRLKQRKRMASRAKGGGANALETVGGFTALVILVLLMTQFSKINDTRVFSFGALALTAVMGGLVWFGSTTGTKTPKGSIVALIAMVLASLNLFLDPFHSDDVVNYVLSLVCMASVVWVCIEMLTLYNRECSNPLPQFETHTGGDDNA